MRISIEKQTDAFTLIEVVVVAAIIGVLATLIIPNFVRSRTTAQQNSCIENLKKIESAKETWAFEKQKKDGDVPSDSDLFGAMLYIKEAPTCPSGGIYDLKPLGEKPVCNQSGHGY